MYNINKCFLAAKALKMRYPHTMRSGFGLVATGILLAVIGVIISTLLPTVSMRQSLAEVDVTLERMNLIQDALKAFKANAVALGVGPYLPCPAPVNLNPSSSSFGVKGTHNGLNPGSCAGAVLQKTTAPEVSFGAVPVRDLGLAEEVAFDGYGRLFSYHVSLPSIFNGGAGGLTVQDSGANPANIAYALISHGKNGHGAYLRGGSRLSSGSTNTSELQNCDCTSAAVNNNYAGNGHIFVRDVLMGRDTATYDDIVRFSPIP